MNEEEYDDVPKSSMFRQPASFGLNQPKQSDKFSSGGLFGSKPTTNFNFSSRLGADEPFRPREVQKKSVFEFSKFDDPKPNKFGKSSNSKF